MNWVKRNSLIGIFFLFLMGSPAGFSQTSTPALPVKIDTSGTVQGKYFPENLGQKYQGDDFDYLRKEQVNQFTLWQRFKMWLARLIQRLFRIADPGESINIVEWIVKIFGILLIVWVLYKIVTSFLYKDSRWIFGRSTESIEIMAHELDQNILSQDFKALIQESLQRKNYRLSIRFYYLWILKLLAEKELIDWDFQKTNYDYYNELKSPELKKQFQYISYLYDYCWYGDFDLTRSEFENGEKSFKNFINQL